MDYMITAVYDDASSETTGCATLTDVEITAVDHIRKAARLGGPVTLVVVKP